MAKAVEATDRDVVVESNLPFGADRDPDRRRAKGRPDLLEAQLINIDNLIAPTFPNDENNIQLSQSKKLNCLWPVTPFILTRLP